MISAKLARRPPAPPPFCHWPAPNPNPKPRDLNGVTEIASPPATPPRPRRSLTPLPVGPLAPPLLGRPVGFRPPPRLPLPWPTPRHPRPRPRLRPSLGSRPRKPALVLVHGFGGNSRWQWEGQIGPLSRSFDLYIPDLVFFGNSRSASRDRSLGYQASCIAEAMQRLGVARYSVVGISYGGFVAFRMAEGPAAGAVERVAILTAGICLTPEQLRDFAAKEERDVCELLLPQNAEDLMNLLRRSKYRHPKWIPAFLLQDFIEVMYRNQRMERSELLKKLLEKGIDLDPIPVLNQDTLILWGDKDDIFPLPLAHRLHRHLGKKSRLEVLKDAGHALQLEKPDQVNHLIEQFLKGVSDINL